MNRREFIRMAGAFIAGAVVGVEHTPVSPYPKRPTLYPTPTPTGMPGQVAWFGMESDYAKWGEQLVEGIRLGLGTYEPSPILHVAHFSCPEEAIHWTKHEIARNTSPVWPELS